MSAKETLRRLVYRVPFIGKRYRDLRAAAESHYRINPGHYGSPIPSPEDISREIGSVASMTIEGDAIPGIVLNTQSQLQLLASLNDRLNDYPFPAEPNSEFRYHFRNDWFHRDDSAVLYALLREFRPKRIIEIGSGFSSAVILDTIDRETDYDPSITFIEPNCERLKSRLRVGDESNVCLIDSIVQDIELALFDQLEDGDFLFIDSSHVSKCGSDVNIIVHEILPQIQSGVIVHVHDIFFPFTYPQRLLGSNHFWNEAYILRAFLANNDQFELLLWNDYLKHHHAKEFDAVIPSQGNDKNIAASIWIRRV